MAGRISPEGRRKVAWRGRAGSSDFGGGFRGRPPDGTIRHIHGAGHPVFNASGDLVEFVGSAMDVSERKQTEEALRQTEYYLAEGERLTHTGSYAWNAASGLVSVSPELFPMFAFDPDNGPLP